MHVYIYIYICVHVYIFTPSSPAPKANTAPFSDNTKVCEAPQCTDWAHTAAHTCVGRAADCVLPLPCTIMHIYLLMYI